MDKQAQDMYNNYYESPLGLIEIKATDQGISQVIFCGDKTFDVHSCPLIAECITQLQNYFNGKLKTFALPLDWKGTSFQEQVWTALTQIPYGKTNSYLDIARAIGNAKAVRAVGGANGRNPISIIVPCHRVIGANATLTGYAGGISRKQWLLKHEGAQLQLLDASPLELSKAIKLRQKKTQYLL